MVAITASSVSNALPGLRYPFSLPCLPARIIVPVPECVMTTALVECPCGYEHLYRTRQAERLTSGVMTRRCKVDRQRYRIVADARRLRAVRRAA